MFPRAFSTPNSSNPPDVFLLCSPFQSYSKSAFKQMSCLCMGACVYLFIFSINKSQWPSLFKLIAYKQCVRASQNVSKHLELSLSRQLRLTRHSSVSKRGCNIPPGSARMQLRTFFIDLPLRLQSWPSNPSMELRDSCTLTWKQNKSLSIDKRGSYWLERLYSVFFLL